MSEFTYGSLMNGEYRANVQPYFPDGTAVTQFNDRWTAFFTGKDTESGPPGILANISAHCPVLYFYNLEDHCWGYQIWHKGDLLSKLHFSYEFEAEFVFSVAGERYPDKGSIVSFLFYDEEGKRILKEIEGELRDDAFFREQLEKHFLSARADDFKLFGFDDNVVEELKQLLSVDAYYIYDRKRAIVEQFKELLDLEEMSWLRHERIDLDREGFEFIYKDE